MKVILCTGSPHSGYEQVFELLVQAGVAKAQPASQRGLTPQMLQSQLLGSQEVDLIGSSSLDQVLPGKLWGQLASDLFLANISQPLWGWADHQTSGLMDFWRDFDHQVRFLLTYQTPQDYLARVLEKNSAPTPEAIALELDHWMWWNSALLRYYYRHPKRCVLINSQHAVAEPQALMSVLANQWQIDGIVPVGVYNSHECRHLQFHLVGELLDPLHPALRLSQELDGAAQLSSTITVDSLANDMSVSVWAEWVNMRVRLEELAQTNSILIANCKDGAASNVELSTQLAANQQENELLLEQLHQMQVELERHILRYQALERQQQSSVAGFVMDFWHSHQSGEIRVDMRKEIVGTNWYYAESDGRWAGPDTVSTICLPPLQCGNYTLSLDVLEAMQPDILQNMVLEAFGKVVPFEFEPLAAEIYYPLVCKAQIHISTESTSLPWQIRISFPHLVSPAEAGSDDHRRLAIRVQALRLSKSI